MKGTLWCKIFGHRFIWTRLVETETSRHIRATGLKVSDVPNDFVQEKYNTDTCNKCGLTKQELGITPNPSSE